MLRNSRLSNYCVKKEIQCFSIDISASKTALLLVKNRNTINRWYGIFRQVIDRHQTALKGKLLGRVEVDESNFGVKRDCDGSHHIPRTNDNLFNNMI